MVQVINIFLNKKQLFTEVEVASGHNLLGLH